MNRDTAPGAGGVGPWAAAQAAHDNETLVAVQQAAAPSQHPMAGKTISVNDCQASSKAASHFDALMRLFVTVSNVSLFRPASAAEVNDGRLCRMRRWFAVLLLALLPLQSIWAAVAAYCGHENGQQTQHLGHHEHQHDDQASHSNASEETGSPAGFDFDCGHCHGNCASMPAALDGVAPLTLASRPVAALEGTLRTLAQSPPERPQWLTLA